MVDTVFPTSGTYTARQGRQTLSPAFAGATAARPLGANTGVRPGTPASTVTVTTTTVTVQPFAGTSDPQTLAIAGPYSFAFDAVTTFTLTAQSASVPRSDIVYVTINDNAEDGSGAAGSSSAVRGYLAGTTTTIPTAPARSFIIAVINVPIVGSSPTVTWNPPYAVAAGGVTPFLTLAALRLTTGTLGATAIVTNDPTVSNNGEWFWNVPAAVWSSGAPVVQSTTGKTSALPNNVVPIIKIERVSATSASNGTLAVTFPTAFPSGVSAIFFTMATGSSNNPVLNSDTLSTTGFTAANLPASTAVVFYYQAIGW